MCLIIYRPKDGKLTKKQLKHAFRNNPEGFGIAVPDDETKTVKVTKGLSGFRKFWRLYREIPQDKPILIHFRVRTSGKIDKENCHPFSIDGQHVLAHNGNMEKALGEELKDKSDTRVFVDSLVRPLFKQFQKKTQARFWAGKSFKWLVEQSIGDRNKIVILDATGFATIFNASKGEWHNDVWFSNNTYKLEVTRKRKEKTVVENGVVKTTTTKGDQKSNTVYTSLQDLPPIGARSTGEIDLKELF